MVTTVLQAVPFAQFQSEVLALYQEPQKRRKTLLKVRQVLRELSPFVATTADLDALAISRWLSAHPGRRPWTRRTLLSSLRAACAWADWKGYCRNPFAFRSLSSWVPADELEEDDPFQRHRSAEEIGRVLARADLEARGGEWEALRLRAAVYVWAFTGAGLLEALGLRIQDVDLPSRLITVRSHPRRRLKTGARAAILPVADPLADVLGPWVPRCECEWLFPGTRRDGPWVHGAAGYRPTDRVRQLGERAGVPGLTVLAFRHSFATLSEDWGIGELMLQRILRHSRPKTQLHYRHHDSEQLRRAAAKVRFG